MIDLLNESSLNQFQRDNHIYTEQNNTNPLDIMWLLLGFITTFKFISYYMMILSFYGAGARSLMHEHERSERFRPATLVPSSFKSEHEIPWIWHIPRGGSTLAREVDMEEVNNAVTKKQEMRKERKKKCKYRLEQQHLLQLRSTFLTEELGTRGVFFGPTMSDLFTCEQNKHPEKCDWNCCLSTVEDPMSCLYSFDAEPNTKVVAPVGTTQYISLSALNRLRRIDSTKVEAMWHSQYAILNSWFSDNSEYSMLQYVGWKGFLVSTVILDSSNGMLPSVVLVIGFMSLLILVMPVFEYALGRIVISSAFWWRWNSWARIVHSALPLKLVIGQLIWKYLAASFKRLDTKFREYIVDLECAIFEDTIPIGVANVLDGENMTKQIDIVDDIW